LIAQILEPHLQNLVNHDIAAVGDAMKRWDDFPGQRLTSRKKGLENQLRAVAFLERARQTSADGGRLSDKLSMLKAKCGSSELETRQVRDEWPFVQREITVSPAENNNVPSSCIWL
jgi:hypothetical protein